VLTTPVILLAHADLQMVISVHWKDDATRVSMIGEQAYWEDLSSCPVPIIVGPSGFNCRICSTTHLEYPTLGAYFHFASYTNNNIT
jgi:hypothetical protein